MPPLNRNSIRPALGLAIGWNRYGRAFLIGWDIGQALIDAGFFGWLRPSGVNTLYWTKTVECGKPRVERGGPQSACQEYTWTVANVTTAPGAPPFQGDSISQTSFSIFDEKYVPTPGFYRAALAQTWVRKAGAPVPTPVVFNPLPGVPGAAALPVSFPLESPGVWPAYVSPKSPPARRPNPGEEPSNAPDAEPDPQHDPRPDYNLPPLRFTVPRPARPRPQRPPRPQPERPTLPLVIVSPNVTENINVLPPTTVIDFVGDNSGGAVRPVVTSRPSRPEDARPPRNVKKQAKVNIAVTMGALWTGLNTVTEVFDFIKAMHDSIPEGKGMPRLSKKASKAQIIEYMATHLKPWLYIDPAEALQNYINMQVGDFVAAIGSEQIKTVYKHGNISTGLDRAIRQGEKLYSEPIGKDDVGNWSDYVPQLDIDAKSGSVSLTVHGNSAVQIYWR